MFTPNDIEILLHCHVSHEPHPRLHAPAVQEAINRFVKDDILYKLGGTYNTTKRGAAWVEMICKTPYPELIYIDPRATDTL